MVSDIVEEKWTGLGSFLAWGVGLGLLAGVGELLVAWARTLGPEFRLLQGREAFWLIPVADGALLAVAAVAVWAVRRLSGGRLSWSTGTGVLAGIAAALILLAFPRIHVAASLLLAAGIGAQVGRFRVADKIRTKPAARPAYVASLLALGAAAVFTVGMRRIAEARAPTAGASAPDSAPSVLILLLDTVRAQSLSLYGRVRPTSPTLERFAAGGVTFDLAFAPAPWTLPSHAALFTGRWPHESHASWTRKLDDRWPTLAEVLRARGYATAGFSANTEYVSHETGLDRGFQSFDDYPVSVQTALEGTSFVRVVYGQFRRSAGRAMRRLPRAWRVRLPRERGLRAAADMNAALLAWLDHQDRRPFFAFVNYMDGHTPFTAPASFLESFGGSPPPRPPTEERDRPLTPVDARARLDRYEGAIRYLDWELGRLFSALERRGLLANTLVVVTADHGEEFAEHKLVGHGHSLYRASLHVPLVLHLSGRVPTGLRVPQPVSLRNVAATVMDLVGDTSQSGIAGHSLARTWRGGPDSARPDTILASTDRVRNQPDWFPASCGDMHSIALNGWRLIRNEGNGREELYDFVTDSLERYDAAATEHGRELRRSLASALGRMGVASNDREGGRECARN
jgi:arylsulfatase A-like enzyme